MEVLGREKGSTGSNPIHSPPPHTHTHRVKHSQLQNNKVHILVKYFFLEQQNMSWSSFKIPVFIYSVIHFLNCAAAQ